MRAALEKTLRSKLEATVQKARDIVETAVSEVLERLGVGENSAPSYLSDDERKLRNRLRAHGRQLGDVLADSGSQSTELLVNEMAYEHWHRMLFARFLEQNHLLMYDPQTPVTLDECAELAADEGFSDGWQLAAKLAEKMLPQIFKTGSPVFDIQLPINHIRALEQLISQLHPDTFQASDSLGWCYQYWQTKSKKEINDSGVKIGGKELSPVTQLFTEPYMVSFLLDNALGAWWAKRRLTADDLSQAPNEQHLRELAAIDGVPLTYLRFVQVGDEGQQTWQPAAGWFDAWPTELKDLKTLDPCCGSGHFLVALFLMLVPIRQSREHLTISDAINSVIRENIYGLELDQRCLEIASFSLTLEAWRYPSSGGFRVLPEFNLACTRIPDLKNEFSQKEIESFDDDTKGAIKWIKETFRDSFFLGSLVEPKQTVSSGKNCDFIQILSSLPEYDSQNYHIKDLKAYARTAKFLSDKYDFVITNPPYKVKGELTEDFQYFIENNYKDEKSALETVFITRCLNFSKKNSGNVSLVLPQNWLFLKGYTKLRKKLLISTRINLLAWLGDRAFETPIGVSPVLVSISNVKSQNSISGMDVSKDEFIKEKKESLINSQISMIEAEDCCKNPDYRITYERLDVSNLLIDRAFCLQGLRTGDKDRFFKKVWEINVKLDAWEYIRTSNNSFNVWGGMFDVILWEKGRGTLSYFAKENQNKLHDMHESGNLAWGRKGIIINEQGLNRAIYNGEKFDSTVSVIFPKLSEDLDAVRNYCGSDTFIENVRKLDRKRSVTNATLLKVPFDIHFWKFETQEKNSHFQSLPFTCDVTQWIYHGHPCGSVAWDETTKWTAIAPRRIDDTVLQVAIARLLGYQWPAELDPEMELADEMRYWLAQNSIFTPLVDDDGIVCIPSVRGEKPAADRLEAILQLAYAEDWSANTLQQLLAAVGSSNLQQYLRDKFFEQHCKIFQQRPFIWQIWDGLKDGFSALVNYHKLDNKGLERLIYTYLGDWIRTQEHGVKEGVDGADIRLTAAKNLETSLKAILEGEKGLDIFVRWKPLHEQSIGWQPDLNDGVRLNIRPFMKATDVGKKGAGVLRIAPKIDWKKDRGTDVPSAPWYHLGPQYGEQEGSRINDHYLTLAEKQAARAEQAKS